MFKGAALIVSRRVVISILIVILCLDSASALGETELGYYGPMELDTLRDLYQMMSRSAAEERLEELTRQQFELNVQLNLPKNRKAAVQKNLRVRIKRAHQEIEVIQEILAQRNDPKYLWLRYRNFIYGIGGLLAMFMLLFVLTRYIRRRTKRRAVKLAGEALLASHSKSTEQAYGHSYTPQEMASESGKLELVDNLGSSSDRSCVAIPIQDMQAHVDHLLLEKPDSYNQLVDFLFTQAILWRASDIHMQRAAEWFEVKFRIDGQLYDICALDLYREREMLNIIKIMANLKHYEIRAAQEGRLEFFFDGTWFEFRVSVIPVMDTEKIVARIFGDEDIFFELDRLGLSLDTTEQHKEVLRQRHGLILVVGPAGSGKTTTMYSSLNYLTKSVGGLNVGTLEDPVEHTLPGMSQVQINPLKNLTFEQGFIKLLRQDSEVIMIGEIRESNVAQLVVRAGSTGHLIISTVHSITTLASIDRLLDFGCEPYALFTSLTAILSQRLVKKVCMHCMQPYVPDSNFVEDAQKVLEGGSVNWRRGVGCEHCMGSGFRGRIVLDELLRIPLQTREKLANMTDRTAQRRILVNMINHSLFEDGVRKAAAGLTTLEEVYNVLGDMVAVTGSDR